MSTFKYATQLCQHLKLSTLVEALPALLKTAEENELTYLQYTELMLDHEPKSRNLKRLAMNRRKALMPTEKYLESFGYKHQTTITKRQINQLLDFNFVDNRHNL